jgi:RsiW-degrading membrane proteinase PrsW (M82 family)
METGTLLLLAVAPVVFWLWYFYQKDRYEPEPLSWILIIYLLGIAVTLPVGLVEGVAALFLPGFLITVLIAPIVEEVGKFLVVRRTVYETTEFDEPVDGMVYAAAAGLGFATLENIIYVFAALETSVSFALQTGLVRALLSVPGHVLFSAMWGYSLGRAKFIPEAGRFRVVAAGLLLAMASHALFNLLLYNEIGFALLVLVLVPLLWISFQRGIAAALKNSVYRLK